MITKRIVVNWLTKRHISSIVNTTQQKETTAMTNSKQTTTFENVEVGDRVFSISMGWGRVVVVSYGTAMQPIKFRVQFDTAELAFNTKGCQLAINTDYIFTPNQVVFWGEPQFETPIKPVVVPAMDVLVRVSFHGLNTALRYSTGMLDDDGNLLCWDSGATSRTTSGHTGAWTDWEVVND